MDVPCIAGGASIWDGLKFWFPQTWNSHFWHFVVIKLTPRIGIFEKKVIFQPPRGGKVYVYFGVTHEKSDQGAVRGGRCHPEHHPCGTVDVAGLGPNGPTGSVTQSRVKLDGFQLDC